MTLNIIPHLLAQSAHTVHLPASSWPINATSFPSFILDRINHTITWPHTNQLIAHCTKQCGVLKCNLCWLQNRLNKILTVTGRFTVCLVQVTRFRQHYNDVIMSATASQITSLPIVYSTVYSRRRSKKTSKLRVTGLVRGIHRNSSHKGSVTGKMFSFDDVIMSTKEHYSLRTASQPVGAAHALDSNYMWQGNR